MVVLMSRARFCASLRRDSQRCRLQRDPIREPCGKGEATTKVAQEVLVTPTWGCCSASTPGGRRPRYSCRTRATCACAASPTAPVSRSAKRPATCRVQCVHVCLDIPAWYEIRGPALGVTFDSAAAAITEKRQDIPFRQLVVERGAQWLTEEMTLEGREDMLLENQAARSISLFIMTELTEKQHRCSRPSRIQLNPFSKSLGDQPASSRSRYR